MAPAWSAVVVILAVVAAVVVLSLAGTIPSDLVSLVFGGAVGWIIPSPRALAAEQK